jgi:succinate dehydrogenase / fumarate reductase membrane anchor subunit
MEFNEKKLEINLKKKYNSALNHWVIQKISALVLLPLLCWFLYVFKDFIYKDFNNKIIWLQDITNSILLTSFLLVALFHLRLGLTVVIEDYIHNASSKNLLLSIIAILCLLLGVFTVIVLFILSTGSNV